MALFRIGYAAKTRGKFLKQLERYNIAVVGDIRSLPSQ